MQRSCRLRLGLLAALLAGVTAVRALAADAAASLGERIYLQGRLANGEAIRGERPGVGTVGAEAACVACHRRSGLGSAEGTSRIPPITSQYLYSRAGVQAARPTLSQDSAADAVRDAYDDASLALAIRSGRGRGGRELSHLMPRYALDDVSMRGLIAYLKSLPTTASPGVSDTTVSFATIVTPDADPRARDGMLAVLNQFIADKNAFIRGGARPLRSAGQIDYRVTRRWQLQVWTLTGAPSTWNEQLRRHLAEQPVFAILSGIGGVDWSPVHRFCESERLPCLFPNVDLPVDSEADFYSVYLSKGLLLEAELIAAQLRHAPDAPHPRRWVQIHSAGNGAEKAASHLQDLQAMPEPGLILSADSPAALPAALAQVRPGDALVLWLNAADLGGLGTPPAAAAVYVSGELGGFEHAPLPAAWRKVASLTYPIDLPSQRTIRMTYPTRWMQIRHVPLLAQKVQADTYMACGIVAEAMNEMLENFMRDYLLERIEAMVSHRQLTALYPRLGLGPGQRFASKGGYIVRFDQPDGTSITPLGDWLVP